MDFASCENRAAIPNASGSTQLFKKVISYCIIYIYTGSMLASLCGWVGALKEQIMYICGSLIDYIYIYIRIYTCTILYI